MTVRSAALRRPLEYQEAIWFINWKQRVVAREPRLALLFHIPNGELREPRIAAKLKAMGVLPGAVDYLLPGAARGFHGLFFEMKRSGLTAEQCWKTCTPDEQWFLNAVQAGGYATQVCSGWVEAAQCCCWYLGREDLRPE